MAVAFDANLGSVSNDKSGITGTISQALTTTAAAAANTRIVILISYWSGTTVDGNQLKVSTVAGGGSFTRDLQVTNPSNSQDVFEVWSRAATAGLAISSTITVTFAPAQSPSHVVGGVLIGAVSFTGLDMTAGGGVDTTGSSNNQSGTSWTSGSASATGAGVAVGGAGNETTAAATSTPSAGTEIHDLRNTSAAQGIATGYNLLAGSGSTNVAGTFSSTSTATTGGIVVYKAATGGTTVRQLGLAGVGT